jgi:hypothetical protein
VAKRSSYRRITQLSLVALGLTILMDGGYHLLLWGHEKLTTWQRTPQFLPRQVKHGEQPDLESCTRVEMRFDPRPFDYIGGPTGVRTKTLWSDSELNYLRSLDVISLTNADDIKALARGLRTVLEVVDPLHPSHPGPTIAAKHGVTINWYRGWRLYATTYWTNIFESSSVDAAMLTPPIREFWTRAKCHENVNSLQKQVWYVGGAFPPLLTWCDAMLTPLDDGDGFPKHALSYLRCPAAKEGECSYAMNAAWHANSPPDTVLFFEAKPGWNQHGGPELFTFDNHDPKGGCVVLNDGTTKFIRTKEELAQLRWKP